MEIQELKDKCARLFEVRAKIDELNAIKKEYTDEKKILDGVVLGYLQENKLKNFDTGFGKVSTVAKFSVKITDRHAFSDFLKSQGIYEDTVNFPAPSVNRIYREARNVAELEGDISFVATGIPGLSDPTIFESISVTGGKVL